MATPSINKFDWVTIYGRHGIFVLNFKVLYLNFNVNYFFNFRKKKFVIINIIILGLFSLHSTSSTTQNGRDWWNHS